MQKKDFDKFDINSDCIGCKVCVETSVGNFALNGNGKAYVKKQPETLEEEALCNDAAELCPVFAIKVEKSGDIVSVVDEKEENTGSFVISGTDNVKKTIDRLPELKQLLIDISPKFRRLKNPVVYYTVCRFMNFERVAKTVNIPVENLIERMNFYISSQRNSGFRG